MKINVISLQIAHLYAHDHPLVKWMTFLEVGKDFHQYHHNRNPNVSNDALYVLIGCR
jgi:hypothetical protein